MSQVDDLIEQAYEKREQRKLEQHVDRVAAMLTQAAWSGVDEVSDDRVFTTWLKMRGLVSAVLHDDEIS